MGWAREYVTAGYEAPRPISRFHESESDLLRIPNVVHDYSARKCCETFAHLTVDLPSVR